MRTIRIRKQEAQAAQALRLTVKLVRRLRELGLTAGQVVYTDACGRHLRVYIADCRKQIYDITFIVALLTRRKWSEKKSALLDAAGPAIVADLSALVFPSLIAPSEVLRHAPLNSVDNNSRT